MFDYTKAIPSTYAGDSFRWFVGTVVNHLAPAGFEGRVQVRIRGIHPAKTDTVQQVDLPWAQVLIPGTEEGSSGLGANTRITTGATVWGFFLDGAASQSPVIVGSFAKTENETPIQNKKKVERSEYTHTVGSNDDPFGYIDSVQELCGEFRKVKRPIDSVVVDWTHTYSNKDIGAPEIDGLTTGGIGYHYVIRRDGTIQRGLQVNAEGVSGASTIDVVLVAGINVPSGMPAASQYTDENSITRSQINSLELLLASFYRRHPTGSVTGSDRLEFDVDTYVSNVFGK